MKHQFLTQFVLFVAAGCLMLDAAPAPVYQNDDVVVENQQIDALTFINNGYFFGSSFADFAYETQNTLNYTNRGFMQGIPGFRFTTVNEFGRKPAASINNSGQITAIDTGGSGTFVTDDNGTVTSSLTLSSPASRIVMDATNIINSGLLSAGQAGLVRITGQNLNLSRGGIRTGVDPNGNEIDVSGIVNTNFHVNSRGIYDYYWGVGTNQVLTNIAAGFPLNFQNSAGVFGFNLFPPNPLSPSHEVLFSGFNPRDASTVQIPLNRTSDSSPYQAFVFTNYVAATSNVINQVVFINTDIDGGRVHADVRFAGGGAARTPMVRLSIAQYDTVLGGYLSSSIYIQDRMLVLNTNVSYTTNFVDQSTGRPNNYFVSRAEPIGWANATISTIPFRPDLQIWRNNWILSSVTNGYSAYSFLVNGVTAPAIGSGGLGGLGGFASIYLDSGFDYGAGFGALYDVTNYPGRVEIETPGTFDARYTRMRGENFLKVKAAHFQQNDVTSLDAPVYSLDLASTNGMLTIPEFMIPTSVERITGRINCYSAAWTNYIRQPPQPSDPTATNLYPVTTHVWIVDDGQISSTTPTVIDDLSLKADNIVLNNALKVNRGFMLDGTNVTLNSNVDVGGDIFGLIGGVLDTISPTNFPSLVNFTNNQELLVGRQAQFGTSDHPLGTFVNNGIFAASTVQIYADYAKTGGTLGSGSIYNYLGGPVFINAGTINMEGATLVAQGDLHLTSGDLAATFSSVRAGGIAFTSGGQEFLSVGSLFIDISGNVDDGGTFANNNWTVTDGFHLNRLPASGDFQGEYLTSRAGRYREVHHTWAGRDLGATEAGFVNNGALGRLILSGDTFPLFVFDTIDGNNALYVRRLVFQDATFGAFMSTLEIKPGMKIYFADANFPIDQLDGQFADAEAPEGRLRFVPTTSSNLVPVSANDTQAGSVAKDLVSSDSVDSDGDGIVNALDATPFDGVEIDVKLLSGDNPAASVSWNGAARTDYQVQYRTALDGSGWESLTNVITANVAKWLTVQDPLGASGERFYRVVYSP